MLIFFLRARSGEANVGDVFLGTRGGCGCCGGDSLNAFCVSL